VSQHLPVPLMDLTTYAKAYKDGLWKWKTDEATDRIRELEERLHERDLAVAALSQQLDDRDAAWERAIQSLAEQGVIMINDPIAAIRERLEAEGGGA